MCIFKQYLLYIICYFPYPVLTECYFRPLYIYIYIYIYYICSYSLHYILIFNCPHHDICVSVLFNFLNIYKVTYKFRPATSFRTLS